MTRQPRVTDTTGVTDLAPTTADTTRSAPTTTPARPRRRYRRASLAPASVVVYRESDPWARPERLRLRVLRVTAALVVLDHADGPAQFDRSTGWGCRAARGGLGAGASGRDWSAWRIVAEDWSRVYRENDSATRRDYRSHAPSDSARPAQHASDAPATTQPAPDATQHAPAPTREP